MKAGIFLGEEYRPLFDKLRQTFEEEGIETLVVTQCICNGSHSLDNLDIVLIHPTCLSGKECHESIASTIDKHPDVYFLLLKLVYRKEDEILNNKPNVDILNREKISATFSDLPTYLKKVEKYFESLKK
jgi:hypothetical protein